MRYKWYNYYNKESDYSVIPNLLPEETPIYLIFPGYWNGEKIAGDKIVKVFIVNETSTNFSNFLRYNIEATKNEVIGSAAYKPTKAGDKPHKGYFVSPRGCEDIAFTKEEAELKFNKLKKDMLIETINSKKKKIKRIEDYMENFL